MISCSKVDFKDDKQCTLLTTLLNLYASDVMGGGEPLSQFVMDNLGKELSKRSFAHAFFAFIDEVPVGLVICFDGFSSFECRPLINIHDVIVHPLHRRKGVATTLLMAVEQYALANGCCKLTMEVLKGIVFIRC